MGGATIQLYAAGTGSTGANSTALLTVTVTSSDGTGLVNANANAGNANNTLPVGSFRITNDYTCPAPEAQVYLLASGGNPGLGAGTNNAALRMMTALGSCGQLNSATNIQINELTTVGAVVALAPYMTSATAIGSTTGAAPALAQEFVLANEYVSFVTGTAPGASLPGNYYGSTLEVNTLGNVLATCVNSAGNTGSNSNCGQLFTAAKPAAGTTPTDTIAALLDIVNNPGNNVGAIFALATAQPVFVPTLTSAPAAWTLPIVPVPVAPIFSPAAGTYASAQTVKISTTTNGAVIYYTTNGSTPTTSSAQYTGPITVAASQTLKAVAVNKVSGGASAAAYTISGSVATPVISLATGFYTAPQTVFLTDATPDAVIYYTIDGTTPTSSSALYTGPFQVRAAETVKAVGISGAISSATASATYTYVNSPTSKTIGTFAGAGGNLTGLATQQTFEGLDGVAVDGSGTVYLADGFLNRIFRIDPATGNVVRVAGNGLCCGIGVEGGQATNFGSQEFEVAVDTAGNLYLPALGAGAIYKVTVATGVITRVAGMGQGGSGYTGEGGPATSAQLSTPYGVAVGNNGDIFIADTFANAVRKVSAATGIITTIAGTGTAGYSGDGGLGTAALVNQPKGVAVDASGNVYIGDTMNNRIRRVSALTGVITTVAGNGLSSATTDGVAATATTVRSPRGLAVDIKGNLYIADLLGYRVRLVTASTGLISTIAGTGTRGNSGDGGAATSAQIGNPYSVALDSSGNVYFADSAYSVTRRIDASTGVISTIAGAPGLTYAGIGGPAIAAHLTPAAFSGPIATDASGNVYYADSFTNTIRKISATTGIMTVFAGTGVYGYSGDGGAATSAQIGTVLSLTISASGNLYFFDGNGYLRKIVLATGVITTVAGNNSGVDDPLYSGSATGVFLSSINALATDAAGNVYLADQYNSVVRKLTVASGTLATVAGNGTYANSGDGGAATSASLENPSGLAVDGLGNLYIGDSGTATVRKVVLSSGLISTIAGTGTVGFSGDGGAASSAQLSYPYGLTVDGANNLYIADSGNYRVRKVAAGTNIISTAAGNGSAGYSGDGGLATQAQIGPAAGVAANSSGTLYVLDSENGVIRVVYP